MLKTLCSAENTSGIAKVGYLFAFFGSGTTCRCCLGARVLFAFFLGLAMAFVALYDLVLCGAIILTFIGTCLMFFCLWRLAEQERLENEEANDEFYQEPLKLTPEQTEEMLTMVKESEDNKSKPMLPQGTRFG